VEKGEGGGREGGGGGVRLRGVGSGEYGEKIIIKNSNSYEKNKKC